MGRVAPTGSGASQMYGNVAVARSCVSPVKLRRRISMGEPASSGLAQQPAVDRCTSMPEIELSPIRSPKRRDSSMSGSPGKGRAGCSIMLQQRNGDVRRVRLPRCRFADLVAASVQDGELPRFYAVDETGERQRLESDRDLEMIVKRANGCAPRVYVHSKPYPGYSRAAASLPQPSSWDSAVYPGSPLSKLANVDSTVDRMRRPKPANPYYDGIVGSLQENTASRPFLNDPDPDHPAFTASRLRRSPILCAKQKRGINTPLPYSLPSFGPAGGMDPRDAGHGAPKTSRLIYTQGTWTMSVPTSKPAIDSRQRHPDVPDELSEFFKRTRLQKFEADLRQHGVESIDELRSIPARDLRDVGFQKLQIEKLSNELARLDQSQASSKKKSEQAQAAEVPATIDAVASALPNLRTSNDFTQPLETMRLRREEDQWDEFAELLLTDSTDVTLRVTRFDMSWIDNPVRARKALERKAAEAKAKATRTWGDAGPSIVPEAGGVADPQEQPEPVPETEPELEKSITMNDPDVSGDLNVSSGKQQRAQVRRSPSGIRGTSSEPLEIQTERKGPKILPG